MMKKHMNVTKILPLIILFIVVAACARNASSEAGTPVNTPQPTTPALVDNGGQNETTPEDIEMETEEDAEPEQETAAYPVYDLGGRVVKWAMWGYSEEQMMQSEAGRNWLNRKTMIEQEFNCTIQMLSMPSDTYFDTIYQAIAAGDTICDIINLPAPHTFTAPLKGGYLIDHAQFGLDLDSPYLDKQIMDLITYGDRVFGIAPRQDSVLINQVCYFNKSLVSQAGFDPDDIYRWQEEGAWTWDRFREIAIRISELTIGDTRVWGTTQNDHLLFENLVVSNGTDLFLSTSDGIRFNGSDPRVLETIEFIKDLYDNNVFNLDNAFGQAEMFYAGTVGFVFDYLERVQWDGNQRSMTDDYGIVMIPKGPQADDYRAMNNWYGFDAVLTHAPEPEKLAALLFARMMPYETNIDWEIVFESYVRDEGSLAVFEMIPSRAYVTPTAMGAGPRDDFRWSRWPLILNGSATAASVMEEVQSSYDQSLRDEWEIQ